jgi:hypothetical protein
LNKDGHALQTRANSSANKRSAISQKKNLARETRAE